ncbi:MAG: cation diffusion facilitator CzcD-associated flavoprotein CzcO [Chitinophagales bacterium]|jgi:cation diffusion facilitator CzcD-associated flavoprotein CzcO
MKAYEVVIIGSGFSGICSAIKLLENKIENFVILERDDSLGGTWWKNSYPGAAVDVPSHLYSFSFEPYDWTRLFAKQEEILAYTNLLIDKNRLKEKSRCKVSIEKLVYQENIGLWNVYLSNQEVIQTQFVISGTGSLSQANIPTIEGLDQFQGACFHSSNWDTNYEYKDKRIAVVGTGASAVQLIPELAKKANKIHVLQRTAHWILPRPDRPLRNWERKLLKIKFFNKFFRGLSYVKSESRAIFFTKIPSLAKLVRLEGLHHLKKQVKDQSIREKLTPSYDIGCKRILLTNDYYPTLQKENVELITKVIESITTTGIRFTDQSTIDLDLIVLATGFHASENAIPFQVQGKQGISLEDSWKDGAYAYYGTMVSNFPNLFFAMGPNTGTGHTSVIYFIESQLRYIMDAIKKSKKNNWKSIEIKPAVEKRFNQNLQKALKGTIWQKGACSSWYLTEAGKNTTMYPNFSFIFRHNTRRFDKQKHLTIPAQKL